MSPLLCFCLFSVVQFTKCLWDRQVGPRAEAVAEMPLKQGAGQETNQHPLEHVGAGQLMKQDTVPRAACAHFWRAHVTIPLMPMLLMDLKRK